MVNFMFCVNNSENIIIINKSKFITNIFYINNLNDINIYLNKIKEKYKDATHHCYAYIINNTKRFNDDGEPNGTAGMPILDCLEKEHDIQQEVFNMMHDRGFYPTPSADTQKMEEAKQKYQQCMQSF